MMSIRLSKKHGANPSITTCIFCKKDTGIALMGALPGDAEAPRYCVVSTEPCDECKANMNLGVALIGVAKTATVCSKPIRKNPELYLTGQYVVIKPEAAAQMMPDVEADEPFKAGFKVLVDGDFLNDMMTQVRQLTGDCE